MGQWAVRATEQMQLTSNFGLWLLLHQGPVHSWGGCGQQGVTWALLLVTSSHLRPQFGHKIICDLCK